MRLFYKERKEKEDLKLEEEGGKEEEGKRKKVEEEDKRGKKRRLSGKGRGKEGTRWEDRKVGVLEG